MYVDSFSRLCLYLGCASSSGMADWQIWLRDCVYKRLVNKGQKPGTKQTLATFLTSAVWHGIEPGYYRAFPPGSVIQLARL
jgi:hypothetical protein